MFELMKALDALILPPTGLLLIALLGLITINRWPNLSRLLLWLPVVVLLLLSLPVTARALTSALAVPRFTPEQARAAQAIVILGGGVIRDTPEMGDAPGLYSLQRVFYGARLARDWNLPVLISGGSVFGGRSEALVMAEALRQQGAAVRWLETNSRSTQENLRLSAPMLAREHIKNVLLVTNDFHMMRAMEECSATELHCWAAPVTSDHAGNDSWVEWLPDARSLRQSALALHEWLGLLLQRYR